MKLFVIPGSVVHFSTIHGYVNDRVVGVLVMTPMKASDIALERVGKRDVTGILYTPHSLERVSAERLPDEDLEHYQNCSRAVFGDSRVHYLATRSALDSPLNNAVVIDKIVVNSILAIRKTGATCLVSSSSPHSLHTWILAKCFECLGLPVYILERTPINDRAWVYAGADRQAVVPRETGARSHALTESSRKLIDEQRNSNAGHRDAQGFYLSRMDLQTIQGADSNDWWSWKRELSQTLGSGRPVSWPLRLFSSLRKRRLYKSYRDVAAATLPGGPLLVYFMHYQPERTSLPDGLFFTQQWLAIRQLSVHLPDGWTLLVREHPTTWLRPLHVSVRPEGLYESIASLPNTQVCSMEVDTFELIDASRAVATLTGSVGFQALLRNRPVLAFGLAPYKDHPACFSVRSADDLSTALDAVRSDDFGDVFTDEALDGYLSWIERNSVCVDPDEPDWMAARIKNFAELYRQIFDGAIRLQ